MKVSSIFPKYAQYNNNIKFVKDKGNLSFGSCNKKIEEEINIILSAADERSEYYKNAYTVNDLEIKGMYEFILANRRYFQNMLIFDKISPQAQNDLIVWLKQIIQMADNYDPKKSKDRINQKIDTEIKQMNKNAKKGTREYLKFLLNAKAESREIVEKGTELYCKEHGEAKFIQGHKTLFLEFIRENESYIKKTPVVTPSHPTQISKKDSKSINPGIIPQKQQIQPSIKPKPKTFAQIYEELSQEINSSDKTITPEIMKKRDFLFNEGIDNNKSFVIKKDLSHLTQPEKRQYFIKKVFPVMFYNDASVLDGLDMFEKYGFVDRNTKVELGSMGRGILLDLTVNSAVCDPRNPMQIYSATDKVINRYLDVYSKFMNPNEPDDIEGLMWYFNTSTNPMYKCELKEQTALRFISVFKDIANKLSSRDIKNIRFNLTDKIAGKFNNNPSIDNAISELEKSFLSHKSN